MNCSYVDAWAKLLILIQGRGRDFLLYYVKLKFNIRMYCVYLCRLLRDPGWNEFINKLYKDNQASNQEKEKINSIVYE